MKKFLVIFSSCFLASCVSLHIPTNHFVPSIVKKNQFESEFSVGTSLSLNAAYSPINHISLMGNLQTLPNVASANFQGSGELALGFYNCRSKLLYGINCGYGRGAYNWLYSQRNDSSSYTLETIGNFQKLTLQAFVAFTNSIENPDWFAGLSFKTNYFMDNYTSLKYSNESPPGFNGMKTNTSFEPCVFTRNFFTRKIYLNGQAGLNISYDETMFWPTQYVFLRIGIGLKL